MHDLKFLEVSLVEDLPRTSFTIDPIPSVYSNFRANFAVAAGICMIPGHCFWAGTKLEKTEKQAAIDIVGSHRSAETEAEKNKVAWKTGVYMGKELSALDSRWRLNLAAHTLHFEGFVAHTNSHMHAVAHNVLKAIVTQAYTALEILIRDLFKRTQHEHQKLVPQKKFSFASRASFRGAYNVAFNDAAIDAALNHDHVEALCLLRNVIVHSAGVADADFMSADPKRPGHLLCPTLTAMWPGMNEGQEIPLDGERVKEIINGAMQQGCQLVDSMEQWLKPRI